MRVALVGAGVVGRFIGRALIAAGHQLFLHDVSPDAMTSLRELGAVATTSAAAAAAETEMMISAVPTPLDVSEVVLGSEGVLEGAADGYTHIMTSTIGPDAARELADRSAAAGQVFLDAPLSAGPQREDGQMQLTLWVSGSIEHYMRARPLLTAFAPYCLYCGPVGNAQIVKLVNNLTTLAFASVLGETLTLGVKAGIPLETLRMGLSWGTAQNRLLDESFGLSVFSGDWRPGYRVDLAAKDVRLAESLGNSLGLRLEETGRLLGLFEKLEARGWGDRSVHSLVRLAEENAGVKLRLQPFMNSEILPEDPGG